MTQANRFQTHLVMILSALLRLSTLRSTAMDLDQTASLRTIIAAAITINIVTAISIVTVTMDVDATIENSKKKITFVAVMLWIFTQKGKQKDLDTNELYFLVELITNKRLTRHMDITSFSIDLYQIS